MQETWSEERVTELKKLWTEGLSASKIATHMHIKSRNAVIGKVYRLGLSNKIKANANAATRLRIRARPAKKYRVVRLFKALIAGTAHPATEHVNVARVSFTDLDPHHCKWPVGDNPGPHKPYFCGLDRAHGLVYCAAHARIAHRDPDSPARPYYVQGVKAFA